MAFAMMLLPLLLALCPAIVGDDASRNHNRELREDIDFHTQHVGTSTLIEQQNPRLKAPRQARLHNAELLHVGGGVATFVLEGELRHRCKSERVVVRRDDSLGVGWSVVYVGADGVLAMRGDDLIHIAPEGAPPVFFRSIWRSKFSIASPSGKATSKARTKSANKKKRRK